MSNNETKALAVLEQHKFELMPMSDDLKDIIAEEMDGLGAVPFDIIKIPSGGGLSFEVPGENEDIPTVATELVGIIVDHHPVNALWMNEYDGSNNQPDCSSFDGKTAVDSNGEIKSCANCPYNQFGTARNGGKGKACKNMHRIYILLGGQAIPTLLVLPPTSIAAWRNYIGKKIVVKGKRPYMVLTKVTLKKEKNEGGIAYSQAVFTKVADLTPVECAELKPMVDGFKAMTRSVAMQSADTFVEGAGQGGFEEIDGDENPFA